MFNLLTTRIGSYHLFLYVHYSMYIQCVTYNIVLQYSVLQYA